MKPIFIAASPNTQKDDLFVAAKQLLTPWNWYNKKSVEKFESQIEEYLGNGSNAIAIDSARSAFYTLLKTYGIGEGDEVLLPSFSCLVIANPVIWTGAKPIYVDVNEKDFNIDLNDLKKKISNRTKAVLIQHTFGFPIEVDKVRSIVGDKIKIIEDVAHALGGEYQGKKLGTLGDASVLTFGIEKVISTVRGGMIITKDKDHAIKIKKQVEATMKFPMKRLIISLKNPIIWTFIVPVYYVGIGKFTIGRVFTWFAHKLNLLGIMIEKCEYKTEKPDWLPARMPGALAELGINQLKKIDKYNNHRIRIAQIYSDKLNIHYSTPATSKHIYLRFPLLVDEVNNIQTELKKDRVVVGDWYKSILYAPQTSHELLNYNQGDTSKAEDIAKRIINLPTGINVSKQDAQRIADKVIKFI